MTAISKFIGLGVVAAGLAAAPAAAQYYPGYGNPYGNGYAYPGYGNPHGYGYSPGGSQVAANQCSAAVQQRLGGYGGYGYGYGYGYSYRGRGYR